MGQNIKQSKHYLGGDSSKEASISLPLRAISSGIIGGNSRFSAFFSALPYAVAVFGVAFMASCLTASIMTPAQNSDASSRIQLISSTDPYYVSIASGTESGGVGLVSKNIHTTLSGVRGVATDTLTITSNVPDGYQVFISMANNPDGQKLVYYGDDSNEGTNKNANYYLSPISSGSTTNPGTLSADNVWGVAVAGSVNSAFSAASAYTDATVDENTKFAPIPAYGAEQLLFETTGQQNPSTPNTVNVYYGYHANASLPPGVYKNLVLYTAWAESTTGTGVATYSGTVNYTNGDLAEADQKEFTFTTSLFTNRTITTSQVAVTITDDITGTQSACNVTSVTKINSGYNDSVRIKCKAPSVSRPGVHSAHIVISDYGFDATTTVKYGTPGITTTIGTATTITTMQGMTDSICTNWASTPSASATTVPEGWLEDTRDGNMYRVRKLADGNCWMTENLRLTFENGKAVNIATGALTTLTSDNSDFTTISSWDGGGHTSETSTSHTVWGTHGTTASSYAYAKSYTFESDTYNETGSDEYRGAVYTWNAATAGVNAFELTAETTVSNSICPKNWRLPPETGNKSYNSLVSGVTFAKILQSPYSFIRSGIYSPSMGKVVEVGHGYWWTSTYAGIVNSHPQTYTFYNLEHGYSGSGHSEISNWGFSVRCVSR